MWRELGLPFPGLFLLKQTETQGSERKEHGWGSATKVLCAYRHLNYFQIRFLRHSSPLMKNTIKFWDRDCGAESKSWRHRDNLSFPKLRLSFL